MGSNQVARECAGAAAQSALSSPTRSFTEAERLYLTETQSLSLVSTLAPMNSSSRSEFGSGRDRENPRQYHRFSDAAQDVVEVRILHGIHFRFADDQALRQGCRVAHWVIMKSLRPVPGA